MGKKLPVIPAIALVAASAVLGVLSAARDDVVISSGIRAYESMRLAALLATVACAAWVAVAAFRRLRAPAEEYGIPDPPEKKALGEADRQGMYQELEAFASGKWKGMAEIQALLSQMDSMDEYQAELGRLLEQTEYLKQDPADIVQRVEDCMYVNVHKLLNYMRIVQLKSRDVMSAKIHECARKNADLLKKTDDFVVAVVSYVNGDIAPGEEEKTKDYVDSYMFVVLDAIELPEAYLK